MKVAVCLSSLAVLSEFILLLLLMILRRSLRLGRKARRDAPMSWARNQSREKNEHFACHVEERNLWTSEGTQAARSSEWCYFNIHIAVVQPIAVRLCTLVSGEGKTVVNYMISMSVWEDCTQVFNGTYDAICLKNIWWTLDKTSCSMPVLHRKTVWKESENALQYCM